MIWPYRVFGIIPDADREAANAAAQSADPDVCEHPSFNMPLSSDGETITHWGANSLAREADLAGLYAMAESLPSLTFWRVDSQTDELQLTNCEASAAKVGTMLTWAEAVQDAGLQGVTDGG